MPFMTEPSRNALAEFEALLADDHGGSACELLGPLGGMGPGSADSAGDQAWVGLEVLVGLDVNEDRALGCADQANELVNGDSID
jgi:hypothetical protein